LVPLAYAGGTVRTLDNHEVSAFSYFRRIDPEGRRLPPFVAAADAAAADFVYGMRRR
jgi:hypothetical protein